MNEIYYEAIKPYITGESEHCSYCDRIEPLILYHGKYFYITVAIGSYMPGYIQLCPYMHRTSATGILVNEYEEFQLLSTSIRISFLKVYGNHGICFEHGQAGSCLWTENHINSLCHHMHLHYLPVEINIHDEIVMLYPKYTIVHNITEMVKVRRDILNAKPYLYFSNIPDVGYMYDVSDHEVPRQFLRNCVAEKLGISIKANWQKYPGIEYFEQTIKDLSRIIKDEAAK